MHGENLIWRKDLFTAKEIHHAVCSRNVVRNEEVFVGTGAHSSRTLLPSSIRAQLAERTGRPVPLNCRQDGSARRRRLIAGSPNACSVITKRSSVFHRTGTGSDAARRRGDCELL